MNLYHNLIRNRKQPKFKNAMNVLTIPVTASFKKKAEISELEKINLFFGYNGSGKTTISRVLNNEDNIFVYNEDFIEENFRSVDKQKGIFTIGKEVGDAKEKIADATLKKAQYQEQLDNFQGSEEKKIKGLINDKGKAIIDNWDAISGKLWSIKTSTDNLKLKECIPGLRGRSEKLATAFIKYYVDPRRIAIPQDKLDSVWKDLIKRSDIVFDTNLEKKTPLRLPNIKLFENIIINEIWDKKITGNKDNNLYELIEQLKNSDWVNQGRDFLNVKGLCPFCQQSLKQQFLDDLKGYFNESYEKDKAYLNQLKESYTYTELLISIKDLLNEDFTLGSQLELRITEFEQLLKSNNDLINTKIRKPSESIKLHSLIEKFKDLGREVGAINKKIVKYNQQIIDREKEEKKLNKDFWDYYTSYYDKNISGYLTQKDTFEKEIVDIEKQVIELKDKISNENKVIADNQSKLTNVQTSINSINNSLTKNGFTSFKVKKIDDDSCRIVRLEGGQDNNTYRSLSEGEKTIISFLYFVELCKGTTDKTKEIVNDRIIVIDDPISSLSHNIVFEVAQIIRTEFLEANKQTKYNQFFLLTHNLYLFYEVRGNIDSIERKIIEKTKNDINPIEKIYNTYRIKKDSDDSSVVLKTDRNEVLTDYDVYWSIVKDCKKANGYKALLPNAMRNILEYYFGFIKNEDDLNIALTDVVDKKFVRFIQRNSHSDKENFTFNIEEIDVDTFLDCFEQVFVKTRQHNH